MTKSKGSSANYYKFPETIKQLQDLIEYREMNFARGNMFKAIFRMGNKDGQSIVDDIDKVIWYAIREKALAQNKTIQDVVDEINFDFMEG